MYISQNTIKVSDLRKNTADVIEEIRDFNQPVIVFAHSTPKIVIMNCDLYEKLKQDKKSTLEGGLNFFIDPPDQVLIKERGIDAVKEIRKLR